MFGHMITSEGDDIRTTMFHPFYVKDLEEDGDGIWVVASNLIKGQELLTEDGKIVYVEEVKIERLVESVAVYNLEIEELHTYFVADGVLVHNMCKISENSDMLKQSNEELIKSKQSYEKLIKEHEKKLKDYIENPDLYDKKGLLKNAGKELRKKIIDGRVNSLLKQLAKQKGELEKIEKILEGKKNNGN